MKKLIRSLLAQYMLIIVIGLFLVQVSFLIISIFVYSVGDDTEQERSFSQGLSPGQIADSWNTEASRLKGISGEIIADYFTEWEKRYPEAALFWVNGDGVLTEQLNVKESFPTIWTPTYTVEYMKEHSKGDPFTVIAFLGAEREHGFIGIEFPLSRFAPPIVTVQDKYGNLLYLFVLLIIALFILLSFLFFRNIRKRLLQLQNAMNIRDVDALPIQITVKSQDEIGQLEQAFNQMVVELRESKAHEQEEERLRRELIANLSHDLRTPLTKMRALSYSIGKEQLSSEGKQSIRVLEDSVVNIDRLIDNLMSYTLLMASKYRYEPKATDVVRFVREHTATWYPVFEQQGFQVDIELRGFEQCHWMIDPIWLGRILDNLFQNVWRHARQGLYIEIRTEVTEQYDAFVITDRGSGMDTSSTEKGAGIGLSIVDMMLKSMKLDWDFVSSKQGTAIWLKHYK